ncbi:hypothetical protein B484DRAFT_451720 [Ochromonadaceae sp. CCMP2298]|nr:hypothetical protein B484DRAFT_451720 [Ochromonadaceae sp. CCMP2298]|mmetsp:Transcript_27716/g.61364  ORF Transcript_27716/g.61364 Transcript_27716/m.61364 type:complete len:1445 (-) Transcript_27716:377-4711(-)
MFSGAPLHKQLKAAILEGNEAKAIEIYKSKELGKTLITTLHPSKPFPSKKNPNGETPMELTSVAALNELFSMFLQFGGRPDIKNSRQESCIHIVCNYLSSATKRSELVEQILKWRSMNPTTKTLVAVGIDDENIDGNTALHLAAKNSLQLCICKLLAAGANLGVLNHENLTAAEFADIMGRETFGSMLELAWLYRNYSKIPLQLNADYTMLCKDRNANTVYVDSDSMTVASFSKFICRLVAFISETTGESPARSEVMLVHYSWDAHLLLKDFEASKQTVFQSVSILPTSEQEYRVSISKVAAPEQALVVRTADNVPVGIPIEEVYMDPSYSTLGPFAIFRGGKKVNYSIRTVNGKAVVVPLDFDPDAKLLMNDDQRVSANSHIKPETTTNCPMCGELMYEPASVQHFLSGDLVEPKHRELSCGSGHKYCNSCWSEYLEAHVTGDEGLDCLQCPAFKCGDMLDLQWAPVLLSSTDLVNRLLAQRQRRVISLVQLQWCPAPKCGLLVHVHKNSPESPVSGDACLSGNIPQCGVCANGHGFCLVCGKEAHSPCTCAEVEQWEGLMRSISKFADPKDSNNAANILRAAPLKKKCAHCGYLNSKFDGSNRCRCTSCHKEYCWTCQQDWEKHLDSDKSDFHCNKFISLQLAPGASEEMNGENSFLADAKTKLFIRHFSRYQTHMDSFKLESIVYRETVSRVMGALQATKGGELFWLSEEDPMPRSGNAECEDTVLAGYYLPKDEVLEFLHGAFKELEKSRLFLRWSYAFSMFNIKGEGAKIKRKFEEKQEALEKNTEALSSLISHRRLRGSKADILAATVATRRQRMASEQLVVEHSSPGGAAGTKSMKQMTMASAGSQGMNEMKMAAASSNSMIERPDASASSQGMMQMAVPQVMVPAGPPGMKQMTVATPVSGNVSSMRQQAAASESSAPPVSARRENSATEESKPRNGSASMQFSTIHEGNEEASKYTASASMTEQSQTMQQTAIVERGVTTTTTSTPAPRFNAESRSRSFNRIDKLSPLGKQQAPAGESGSSKLSRNASFRTGRVVEYISEEEAVLVYAIMKENNVSRDKAVQMFLNDHDTRLYNPKAVYLFPGEVYTEELEKAAEEEVQIQTNFGRVEYNQRKEQEIEITQTVVESDDESYMEQRLIGAKKDPDQEALEHAMLLSAQEDEFGINMYDSLSPADEIVLADYMSQGFTRSEGALIIFEEKFGKVSSFRNTSLIPAMPTLHAVHEAIADDDPEVVDLILRGYTCEQAVAVIMQHRERTRAAAAAPDPAHYEPHPDEERFQLTEKEERDVQANMDRSGLSRRDSVMMVVQTRSSSSSAQSRTSREEVSSYDDSYELRSYMDRGYTRDQAQQMIRRQSAGGNSNQGSYSGSDSVQYRNNTNSTSFYSQQNSFSSGAVSGGGDDSDVLMYMDRGYTREQAMQLVRRNPRGGQSASRPVNYY